MQNSRGCEVRSRCDREGCGRTDPRRAQTRLAELSRDDVHPARERPGTQSERARRMIDSDFTHNTCQEIAEDASKTRGDSDDDRLLAGEAIDAVLKGQGKLRTYTQTFTALRTALFVWLEYVKARHAVMRLED